MFSGFGGLSQGRSRAGGVSPKRRHRGLVPGGAPRAGGGESVFRQLNRRIIERSPCRRG